MKVERKDTSLLGFTADESRLHGDDSEYLARELRVVRNDKKTISEEIEHLNSSLSEYAKLEQRLEKLELLESDLRKPQPKTVDGNNATLYSVLSSDSVLEISGKEGRSLVRVEGKIVEYKRECMQSLDILLHSCPECGKEHPVVLRVHYYSSMGEPYNTTRSRSWSVDLLLACVEEGVIKIAISLSACSKSFQNPVYENGTKVEAYDYSKLICST